MKIFCCCLLLLLGLTTAAQKQVPARLRYAPHQFAVNISPLPLLNPDQRLMAGVERRFAPAWSVAGDVGLVLSSTYTQGIRHTLGFELRPALRYYYGHNRTGYIQGQLQYRLVNYKLHEWLGKDCVNGVPAYEQLQDFTFRKQVLGAALVAGGIERLGQHWLLDVSVGLGMAHRSQKVAGEEACCYLPGTDFFGNAQQENIWTPIIPIAVKLAYVVK